MDYIQLTKQKNSKRTSALLVSFYCLTMLLLSTTAKAQGVVAGTDIANKAIVIYTIAGDVQAPIESSPTGNMSSGLGHGVATRFKVDRKIDLLLTGNKNASVAPGDSQKNVSFTLVNEGNDTQEFSLSSNSTLASDNFDSSNCQISVTQVKDSSGTLVTGLSLPLTGNISLQADYQAAINVSCDIPQSFNNKPLQTGQTALVSLTAKALKNADGSSVSQTSGADSSNQVDTVFVDGKGTDDNKHDASHSARRTFTSNKSSTLPTLTINKSLVSVLDAEGGNSPISGAKVTYKITVKTTGSGVINDVVISDPTPEGLTYKKDSIYLNNINLTDSSDYDKVHFDNLNNVSIINLGIISAGLQNEILLSYTIN